jgi:hypothetical protein
MRNCEDLTGTVSLVQVIVSHARANLHHLAIITTPFSTSKCRFPPIFSPHTMTHQTPQITPTSFSPSLDDAKPHIAALPPPKTYRILYTVIFASSERTTAISFFGTLSDAQALLAGAAHDLQMCPNMYVVMSENEMGLELFQSVNPRGIVQTYRIAEDIGELREV